MYTVLGTVNETCILGGVHTKELIKKLTTASVLASTINNIMASVY